jgi:hypothetical protein
MVFIVNRQMYFAAKKQPSGIDTSLRRLWATLAKRVNQ